MKELYDDSDFEQEIRDKLQGYKAKPDESLKSNILTGIGRGGAHSLQRIAVATSFVLLFIVWLLMTELPFLRLEKDLSDGFKNSKGNANQKLFSFDDEIMFNGPYKPSAHLFLNEGVKRNSRSSLVEPGLTTDQTNDVYETHTEEGMKFSELPTRIAHLGISRFPFTRDFEPISLISFDKSDRQGKQEMIERKKEQLWGFYSNIHTFWTFQRAIPNKSDEWIVESIISKGRLSTERMGVALDLGTYFALSDRFEAYGGLVYYFQQFDTRFSIRSSRAEDMKIDESLGGYDPIFEERIIEASKEIWSAGVKMGMRYYLPYGDKKFWLGSDLDYQHTITEIPREISMNQDQLYFNIRVGWSKQLSDELIFNMSPGLSYSIFRNDAKGAFVLVQPYSYGVNLGLQGQLSQTCAINQKNKIIKCLLVFRASTVLSCIVNLN